MAIERGHLSVFTKWMLWSDTPVRGRKSTLPNPYFYFVFVSSFSPPKHTHTHTHTHTLYLHNLYIAQLYCPISRLERNLRILRMCKFSDGTKHIYMLSVIHISYVSSDYNLTQPHAVCGQ